MSHLQKIDGQFPKESSRRSDLDLVFWPVYLYGNLLLHSFLCGQLPRYGVGVRGLPMCEGASVG